MYLGNMRTAVRFSMRIQLKKSNRVYIEGEEVSLSLSVGRARKIMRIEIMGIEIVGLERRIILNANRGIRGESIIIFFDCVGYTFALDIYEIGK